MGGKRVRGPPWPGVAVEGRVAAEKDVCEDAEGPDVALLIVPLLRGLEVPVLQDLWCDEVGGGRPPWGTVAWVARGRLRRKRGSNQTHQKPKKNCGRPSRYEWSLEIVKKGGNKQIDFNERDPRGWTSRTLLVY